MAFEGVLEDEGGALGDMGQLKAVEILRGTLEVEDAEGLLAAAFRLVEGNHAT